MRSSRPQAAPGNARAGMRSQLTWRAWIPDIGFTHGFPHAGWPIVFPPLTEARWIHRLFRARSVNAGELPCKGKRRPSIYSDYFEWQIALLGEML